MHRRQRVREAMITVLTAANTAAQARVFGHRAVTLRREELPALRVYTRADAVIPNQSFDGDVAARIALRVDALCKDHENVEAAVDALCEEVETAVRADPMLSGACAFCQFQSTDVDWEDEDKTTMVATLEFEAVVSS